MAEDGICQSCWLFKATKKVLCADGKRRWRCDHCLARRTVKKAKARPRPPVA